MAEFAFSQEREKEFSESGHATLYALSNAAHSEPLWVKDGAATTFWLGQVASFSGTIKRRCLNDRVKTEVGMSEGLAVP